MKKIDIGTMYTLLFITTMMVMLSYLVYLYPILTLGCSVVTLVWFVGVPYTWNKIVDWKEKKDYEED